MNQLGEADINLIHICSFSSSSFLFPVFPFSSGAGNDCEEEGGGNQKGRGIDRDSR